MYENLINNLEINFENLTNNNNKNNNNKNNNNKNNNNKNIQLENLLSTRVPPFSWDLIGYLFGLFVLFHGNDNLMIFGGIFFAGYGALNIIFDTFTFSCEYTNDGLPKHDELEFYNWTIVNKKYNLKNGIEKNINNTVHIDTYFRNEKIVDASNIKLELSFYVGNNEKIESLLNYIYLFGITKKNYTQINRDKLKEQREIFI
jgi:hypothetical protein